VSINYRKSPEDATETEQQVNRCLRQVRQEGVKEILVKGNVAKEQDVIGMVAEVVEKLGGLDVLVNNAGIQIASDSHELTTEQIDRVLGVNLRGAFMCAREAIKHFLGEEKPGVVINVSSVHQVIPKPRFLGYSMSKGGMQNLTRTLALEYAGRKIRVNSIGPGATVTPINRAWVDDPEKSKMVLQHIPMGRAETADEMGAVAAFLASDEAAYVTIRISVPPGPLNSPQLFSYGPDLTIR
jgi:glucose 1-dehydrogenase